MKVRVILRLYQTSSVQRCDVDNVSHLFLASHYKKDAEAVEHVQRGVNKAGEGAGAQVL